MKKPNTDKLLTASLLFLLLLPAICSCKKGNSGNAAINGINAVLTNEMSDCENLTRMEKDVRTFMQRWQIRGMELAIMRNDSLLYAKGFGWADEEKEEAMRPGTIMRVASVSKLVTAAGIMKLVEDGKLSLGDKVFGRDGILKDTVYTNYIKDKGYYDITVEQLLRHEGGLTIRRGDPMFRTRDLMNIYHLDEVPDQNTLTSIAVRKRLGYTPGKSHEYSNFGYLLLSMIIEQATGTDYEEWMQKNVLEPAGCLDFHLAYNSYEERHPGETRYHMQENDPKVPKYDNSADSVVRCYGGNDIRALKGAGAWVCSAPELARFVAGIDGRPGVPDILSKKSVNRMTAYSEDHKFGLGWNSVDPAKGWQRTGSISGTSAYLMNFPDGECWILISNTHAWKGPRFSRTIHNFIQQCRQRYSAKMPAHDLFTLIQ